MSWSWLFLADAYATQRGRPRPAAPEHSWHDELSLGKAQNGSNSNQRTARAPRPALCAAQLCPAIDDTFACCVLQDTRSASIVESVLPSSDRSGSLQAPVPWFGSTSQSIPSVNPEYTVRTEHIRNQRVTPSVETLREAVFSV